MSIARPVFIFLVKRLSELPCRQTKEKSLALISHNALVREEIRKNPLSCSKIAYITLMNNMHTIHYLVMLQDKNLLNYNPGTKKFSITQKGKKSLQLCSESRQCLIQIYLKAAWSGCISELKLVHNILSRSSWSIRWGPQQLELVSLGIRSLALTFLLYDRVISFQAT